jgi:hypothetical protein
MPLMAGRHSQTGAEVFSGSITLTGITSQKLARSDEPKLRSGLRLLSPFGTPRIAAQVEI